MRTIISFIISCLLIPTAAMAAAERNLLVKSTTKEQLSSALVKDTKWIKFPSYKDRQAWESFPQSVRQSIIQKGEAVLNFDWPIVKATDYLEFTRSGNRDIMQKPQNDRQQAIRDLAMAELVEGKGRFIEPLINGVWAICEQSSWLLSAHIGLQKRNYGLPDADDIVIDLAAGNIGAMLAWIHYFLAPEFDKVNPLISAKIRREIKTRILDPYYTREDMWWMGFDGGNGGMVNNWNVWVNHNAMQCILLMETDQAKRTEGIYKAMRSIDKFINYYPNDGYCDEGPSYWGHAGGKLFECLDLLHQATNGKVDIYGDNVVRDIGRYIYRAYVSDPYFVNFADAGAKGSIYSGLVYRYGKAIKDETMQGFASFYANKRNMAETAPTGTIEVSIQDMIDAKEIVNFNGKEPLIKECWLAESQFVVARDKENSREGFFFAAKGGHNEESHNHNDVGTCILYYNGLPVLVDVGVGTYTRQTFSNERYSIWTMQSGYHNLPVINGVDQKNGKIYAARNATFKSSSNTADYSVDITNAYPPEAKVKSWRRGYKLQRGKSFTISDQYSLLENNGKNAIHFMTSCQATIVKPGLIRLESEGFALEMSYNASAINARIENIEINDQRLKTAWNDKITRVMLDITGKGLSGSNDVVVRAAKK